MANFLEFDLVALLLTQFWQVTLLAAAVWIATKLLANDRPHLAHALWALVLIKCITPPIWCSPTSPFCWMAAKQSTARNGPELADSPALKFSEFTSAEVSGSMGAIYHVKPMIQFDSNKNSILESAEAPPNQVFNWRMILKYGWIWGAAIGMLIAAIRFLAFWVWMRRRAIATPPRMQQRLDLLARKLGVKRHVCLQVIDGHVGPAVLGLFRPKILMPAVILHNKSHHELEPLLAHELVHVRRGDLIWAMIQTTATSLFWFHPFVWIASNMVTRESERSCDEETVASLGCSPISYARGLLDVLEQRNESTEHLRVAPALPGVRPVDITSARLERVMKMGNGSLKRTPPWIWLLMFVCGALVLPGAAMVRGQESEQPYDSTGSLVLSALPAANQALVEAECPNEPSQLVVREQNGVPFMSNVPYFNRLFAESAICCDKKNDWELSWFDAKDLLAGMRQRDGMGQTAEQQLMSLLPCSVRNRDSRGMGTTYRLKNGDEVKLGHGEPTVKIIGDAVFVLGSKDEIAEVGERLNHLRKFGEQQIAVDVKFMTIDRTGFDSMKFDWQVAGSTLGKKAVVSGMRVINELDGTESKAARIPATYNSNHPVSAATFVEKTPIALYAIVDNARVRAVLENARENQHANIMMSPKVIVNNGQHASVKDVVGVPFVVGFQKIGQGAHQPEIRIVEEGLTINLHPIIQTDNVVGNHIRLNCQLEKRNVIDVETEQFVLSREKPAVSVQVPEVKTTRIESTLDVQLGKTVVLSSQMKNEEGQKETLLVFLSCQIVKAASETQSSPENGVEDADSPTQPNSDAADADLNSAKINLRVGEELIQIHGTKLLSCEISGGVTLQMRNGQSEASADSITLKAVKGKTAIRLDGQATVNCDEEENSETDDARDKRLPGLGVELPLSGSRGAMKKYLAFITALSDRNAGLKTRAARLYQ